MSGWLFLQTYFCSRRLVLIGMWGKGQAQQTRVQFEESTSMTRENCDTVLHRYPAGGENKVKEGNIVVTETGTTR